MTSYGDYVDITVELQELVAVVEIQRGPNNFFDEVLIRSIAHAFEDLDGDDDCRCIVLGSAGKHFCAGANFTAPAPASGQRSDPGALYRHGIRLFKTGKPIVAAIQGAAVGGGLGLAVMADFRVACEESRFSANFTRLGFHPGFGLTVTLPELIGKQNANLMFFTGRRIKGAEALRMGLADMLVPLAEVRSAAVELAREIATSAPLAVQSTRATVRVGLADRVALATDHELAEQTRLRMTADYSEGIRAMDERRTPDFKGE